MPKRKTPSGEESTSSNTTSTQTPSSTTTPLDRILYNFFSGIRPYLRPVQPHISTHPVHSTPYSSPPITTSTSTSTSTTTHPTTHYRSHYELIITSTPTMPHPHPSPHPTSSLTHHTPQRSSLMPPPLHPIPKSHRSVTSTLTRPIPTYTRPPPPLHPIRTSSARSTSTTRAHPMRHRYRGTPTMSPPLRHIQPRPTSTTTQPANIASITLSPPTPFTSQPTPCTYSLTWASHYTAFTLTSTYSHTSPQPTIPSLCHINLTHTLSSLPPRRTRTVGTQTDPPRTRRHSV